MRTALARVQVPIFEMQSGTLKVQVGGVACALGDVLRAHGHFGNANGGAEKNFEKSVAGTQPAARGADNNSQNNAADEPHAFTERELSWKRKKSPEFLFTPCERRRRAR